MSGEGRGDRLGPAVLNGSRGDYGSGADHRRRCSSSSNNSSSSRSSNASGGNGMFEHDPMLSSPLLLRDSTPSPTEPASPPLAPRTAAAEPGASPLPEAPQPASEPGSSAEQQRESDTLETQQYAPRERIAAIERRRTFLVKEAQHIANEVAHVRQRLRTLLAGSALPAPVSYAEAIVVAQNKFNMAPNSGIDYLVSEGHLLYTPEDVAAFLYNGQVYRCAGGPSQAPDARSYRGAAHRQDASG